MMMSEHEPTVFVVDDDKVIGSGIAQLIETVGLKAKCFASAHEFMDHYVPDQAGCLVLDVRMPGMSGLMLRDKLAEKNINLPIIFITGHGNVKSGVDAIKKGAIDYIEKPFDDQVLLDQIQRALEIDAQDRQEQIDRQVVIDRVKSLTSREESIMYMVADGKLNKAIAYKLGISLKTVEARRANVMKKMQVDSLAALIRLLAHTGMLQ
ncbi:MAG: response regulator transcription factor [Planctomycetota bacterium]|jgi:FixJ family two-component response regulator